LTLDGLDQEGLKTPAELLAARMVAADPHLARKIAEQLARDLLEVVLACRHVDKSIPELVVALRAASSGQPAPVRTRNQPRRPCQTGCQSSRSRERSAARQGTRGGSPAKAPTETACGL
jgi:hypothetical protein